MHSIEEEIDAHAYDPDEFLMRAKELAKEAYNADISKRGLAMKHRISVDQVYVVWFSKTLQHWKALLSTTVVEDTAYIEVTHNGLASESYVDLYRKRSNTVVPDDET